MSEIQAAQSGSTPYWRRLLAGWIAISTRFGGVQTLLLLSLVYLVLIGPVSIVQALARRDLLDKRGLHEGDTAWQEADTAGADFERSKLLS